MQEKQRGMILLYFFFQFVIISSAGSLLASKIFTLGKILQLSADHHARLPLCKMWAKHRSSVPFLVSSPAEKIAEPFQIEIGDPI